MISAVVGANQGPDGFSSFASHACNRNESSSWFPGLESDAAQTPRRRSACGTFSRSQAPEGDEEEADLKNAT